jgi:hypothetical protein
MAEYLITLAVETEEGQGDPADWDWATLVDSPLPVGVVTSTEVTCLSPITAVSLHLQHCRDLEVNNG